MFLLEVRIDFGSAEGAKRFFDSIKPELKEDFARSTTKITLKKAVMGIIVKASDKSALRASLNAFAKPLILFNAMEELQ